MLENRAEEVTGGGPSDVRRSFKAVPIVVHPELLKGQQQQAPSLTVRMECFDTRRADEHSLSSRNAGAVNETTQGAIDETFAAGTCVSVGKKRPTTDAHLPAPSLLSLESFKASIRNVSILLTSLIGISDGGLLEDGEDHPSDAVVAKRRLAITRYLHSMSDFTATGFVSLLRPHELLTLSKMLEHVESLALEANAALVSHGKEKRSGTEGEDDGDTDTPSSTSEVGELVVGEDLSDRKQKKIDGDVDSNAPDYLSCALIKKGGAARVVAKLFEVNTSLIRLSEPIDQTTPLPSTASSTSGVISSVSSVSAGHLASSKQTLRLRQELSTLAKCILLASEVTNASTAERLGSVVQGKLLPKLSLTLAALRPHDGSLVDVISLRSIVELFWSLVPAISTIVTYHLSATSSQASTPATLLHSQATASGPSASDSAPFPATTVDHSSSSSFAPGGGGGGSSNRVSALALKSAHFVKLKSSVSVVEAMSTRATQLNALLNEQKARLTGLLERTKTAISESKTSNSAGGSGASAVVDASPTDDNADDNTRRQAQLEATDFALIEEEVRAVRATLSVITSEIKAARTAVVNEANTAINSFWKNAAEAGERAALHAYSLLVCPQSSEPFLTGTDSAASAITSPLGYLLPDSFVTLLVTFVESFDSPHSSLLYPLPTSTSFLGEGFQLGTEFEKSQIGSFVLVEGRRLFNLVVSTGSDDAMDLTGRSSFAHGGLSSPTGGGTGLHGEEAWRDALAVADPRPCGSATIAKSTLESSPSACKRECGSPSRNRGRLDQGVEGGASPAVTTSRAEAVLRPYRYAASGASSPWAETVGSPSRNNDLLAQIAARRRQSSLASDASTSDSINKALHREPIANTTGGVAESTAEKGQMPEPTNTHNNTISNNNNTNNNGNSNTNDDIDNSNSPSTTSTRIVPAIGAKRERGNIPQNEPRGADSSLSAVCGNEERTPTSKLSASILPKPSPHGMFAKGPVDEQESHLIDVNGGESTSKRIRFEEDSRGGGATPAVRHSQQLSLSSASPDSRPHHERPEEKRNLPSNASSASASLTPSGSSVPSFLLGPTTNTASVFSRSGNRPVSVSIIASDGTTTRLSAAAIAEADAAGTTVNLASANALSPSASNTDGRGGLPSGVLLPPPVSSSASLIPTPYGHHMPDPYSTNAGGAGAGAGAGILGRASSHMLDGVPRSATASIGPPIRPGLLMSNSSGRERGGGGDAILSLDSIIGLGIGAGDGGGRYSLSSSHDGLFAPFGMSSSSDASAGQRGGLCLGLGGVGGISRGILSASIAGGAAEDSVGGWGASTPPSSFGLSVARAKQVLLEIMLGSLSPQIKRPPNDDTECRSSYNCGVPDALRILLNHLYFSKGGGLATSGSRSCPPSLLSIISTCVCSCCGQLPLISPLSYSASPQYGRTVLGAIMPSRQRGAPIQTSSTSLAVTTHNASSAIITSSGEQVLGGTTAPCGEGILSKPSLLAAPTTSQGVLSQGVGILGDGGHVLNSASAFNASSSSSDPLALLVSVAELASQTHSARDGGGRRTVSRGGGGGHIAVKNNKPKNMGAHANSDALAATVLSYHLNVLSAHFPLRFTCCGSLQCPSCCDLNVCAVCGEEDLIPTEAREAILMVVAEAAKTEASATAARWLSEEAAKARGPLSSSTTGRSLQMSNPDGSSPSKKALTATPTAPFILPPLITLVEISVELDVLQGGLVKTGKGPMIMMMTKGHHRPSMSPCASPALRGVSASNPTSFARSESRTSVGSLGGTARSGGSATASPSLLAVPAPSQTAHSLSCADLSRASCAPHSNCSQQPLLGDLICLLLGSGGGGRKLRWGYEGSQARSDEPTSGDDEKSARGDRDEGLHQGPSTALRVRAGQLCQSVDGELQRSKMVYIVKELLSELN